MALNMVLRKASGAPALRRRANGSCIAPAAPRSRNQIRPQAFYIVPRIASSCRPARYYRAPGLGLAGGIHLLNNMLSPNWLREAAAVHPVEITTQEDRYELQTDCPGMSREDISIEISPDRVLTITGVRTRSGGASAAAATNKQQQRQQEGSDAATATASAAPDVATAGATEPAPAAAPSSSSPSSAPSSGPSSSFSSATYRFRRSFSLPEDADEASVTASLDHHDGVLALSIARRRQQPPEQQTRRVAIN